MIRQSTTKWQGDGPSGRGSLSTESGAEAAKVNCPVSKALAATPISLTARLA
jgi:hypothetical protein